MARNSKPLPKSIMQTEAFPELKHSVRIPTRAMAMHPPQTRRCPGTMVQISVLTRTDQKFLTFALSKFLEA